MLERKLKREADEYEGLLALRDGRIAALEASEARLREALEQWPDDGSVVHEQGCAVELDKPCDCFTAVARAALSPAAETDGVAE